jgi:hypothetical protein
VKGRIAPEDAHFLSKNLDFLLEEVNLMRNPLPVIRCGFRKYFGPSDALLACTFGEFSSACALLEAYNQSKEPQYLDELVAVLYRPGKWFRKVRRRFSDNQDPRRKLASRTLKERIKRISRLDPAVKQAVFLFFSGTLNYLARHFPYVYHPGTGEPFQENNWATLIISLADGRTDDESLERVTSSNLYNVLIGLNKKAKEYQDYLSQIQSHDRHRSLR